MAVDDKRKDPRIQSTNLISYVSCDENDQEIRQGMGRTLNVSEGGILLETHVPIDPHHVVTLTIALEDELMEFKGRIAHSMKREDGGFTTGIKFIEMNEEKRQFLGQYVLFFRGQESMV
jgi:c-di-GMP-binding flagellar brake protein YcgR